MTRQSPAHIEPSEHSTPEVDQKLRDVEDHAAERGAESPAIKPDSDLAADGKPVTDAPRNANLEAST